jgi:hypothetical protein
MPKPKWLVWLGEQVMTWAVAAILISSWAALKAYATLKVQPYGWAAAAVVGAIVFLGIGGGVTVFVILHRELDRKRRKRVLRNRTPEQFGQTIKSWLDEQRYSVRNVNTSDGKRTFALQAVSHGTHAVPVEIFSLRSQSKLVHMQAVGEVVTSDEVSAELRRWLPLQLLPMKCDFAFAKSTRPDKLSSIRITVNYSIESDEIRSSGDFFRALGTVIRGGQMAQATAQFVGAQYEPPPKLPPGPQSNEEEPRKTDT